MADIPLVQKGHIALRHITTLRAGELAYDPVYQKLIPLEQEALKINGTKEHAHPWHCLYHSEKGCGLHPLRPAQCKALFCVDTTELQSMYHEDRAARTHILPLQQGWLELAEAHEEQCPLRPLIPLAQELYSMEEAEHKLHSHSAAQELLHSLRYDLAFRELCTEKAQINVETLPCILGRPLYIFMESLGFTLQQSPKGDLQLKKLAKAPYFA